MKERLIRPAGIGAPAPYAIFEFIEANRAKAIFYGTAPECYEKLNELRVKETEQ